MTIIKKQWLDEVGGRAGMAEGLIEGFAGSGDSGGKVALASAVIDLVAGGENVKGYGRTGTPVITGGIAFGNGWTSGFGKFGALGRGGGNGRRFGGAETPAITGGIAFGNGGTSGFGKLGALGSGGHSDGESGKGFE
ncbi:hypothetical protein M5K25_012274 [Dendrobium thyrsiflorum]|uniref:Uncharacterized protein n=1 Tax=Dendrobium thyrsiflorum TaxID=117978 RepID=A0ABD0UXH9_DENTH